MFKSSLLTLLLLSIVIALAAIAFAKTPQAYRFIAVATVYCILGLFFIFSKDRLKLTGLSQDTLLAGVKLALPFMLLVFSGALVIFNLQPELFQDARYNMSLGKLLFSLLIVLPFATVLVEELIFRGLLFGQLSVAVSTLQAALISSLFFGIWHIFSAQAVNVTAIRIPQVFMVLGVLLATAVAGLFFTWLRIRSGSLLAPILVHWSINATGMILSYAAWRVS